MTNIITGIILSISRIEQLIRNYTQGKNTRVSNGSSVYLASVLEYIIAEILDLSGNRARDDKKVVIKIDTEGNELSVLKGANRTLSEIKPLVIFECFKEAQREEIFNFFESKKYAIYKLPFKNVTKKMALTLGEFTISNDSNFFAKT